MRGSENYNLLLLIYLYFNNNLYIFNKSWILNTDIRENDHEFNRVF